MRPFPENRTVLALAFLCGAASCEMHSRNQQCEQAPEVHAPSMLQAGAQLQLAAKQEDVRSPLASSSSPCPVCHLAGDDAPVLYVAGRTDGVGARAMAIANLAAVASKFGMAFGGEIHSENNPHGVDSRVMLEGLFGSDVMRFDPPPPFTKIFPDLYSLEAAARARELKPGRAYFLDTGEYWAAVDAFLTGQKLTLNYFFTPEFLRVFRASSTYRQMPTPLFAPGRLSVAIHVRRGDSSHDFMRATSNEFYFAFVDTLRSVVPDADIHVWSSNEGFLPPTYFEEYERRGMKIHIDTDVAESWAHFSKAHVFVQAKSAFSHVPAFLNENCVIQLRFWHHPLAEWTLVDDMDTVQADPIRECLKRVKRPGAPPDALAGTP